ncbi:MAG: hypothetical protein AAFU79_07860 [Myxococcota bacterium]
MFAELDRVDLVYETSDGERIGVQTDHRGAAEQAAEPDLSLIFAVLRVLTARGLDGVVYAAPEEPPGFLRTALEMAGARVSVQEEELEPLHPPDSEGTDDLVRAALEGLGRSALEVRGLDATRDDLTRLERGLLEARGDGFSTVVEQARAWVELAAATGVVFSALHGGAWGRRDLFGDTVPYAWVLGDQVANVFGRAHRLVSEGVSPGPSAQLDTLAEPAADGPILPLIRPAGFGGEAGPRSQPLLTLDEELEGVEVPHIFLVRDRPSSVEYLDLSSEEDFDELLEASLHNLARLGIRPKRIGALPIYLLDEHFFAGSKVLDRSLVQGLAETLDAEVLFASFPARGAVVVGAGEATDFLDLTAQLIANTPESERVSEEVFLVTPGEGVCGVIRAEVAES